MGGKCQTFSIKPYTYNTSSIIVHYTRKGGTRKQKKKRKTKVGVFSESGSAAKSVELGFERIFCNHYGPSIDLLN